MAESDFGIAFVERDSPGAGDKESISTRSRQKGQAGHRIEGQSPLALLKRSKAVHALPLLFVGQGYLLGRPRTEPRRGDLRDIRFARCDSDGRGKDVTVQIKALKDSALVFTFPPCRPHYGQHRLPRSERSYGDAPRALSRKVTEEPSVLSSWSVTYATYTSFCKIAGLCLSLDRRHPSHVILLPD